MTDARWCNSSSPSLCSRDTFLFRRAACGVNVVSFTGRSMGHHIQGVIFCTSLLHAARELIPSARGAVLDQGFCFVPITDRVFDELRTMHLELVDAENGFERLSAPLEQVVKALSRHAPVAYVETEYFGGIGAQAAVVWRDGELVLSARSRETGPINGALALLGVDRRQHRDEFDALGLSRYRSNGEWFQNATEAQ